MDLTELGGYLFPGMRDFLKIEALDYYAADPEDFRRWREGHPLVESDTTKARHERFRTETARGITWRRIHVVTEPLSDYLMYECEWGYAGNAAAGEDIRMLTVGPGELAGVPELFVVNGERVAISHYINGAFSHADRVGRDSGYWIDVAADMWARAEPFDTWWAARPQYQSTRTRRVA